MDIDVAVFSLPSAFLEVYIDFNQDGDFDEPNEGVYSQAVGILDPGIVNITTAVPPGAIPGNTFARLRINNTPGPIGFNGSGGFGVCGEVEDHEVTIQAGGPTVVPAFNEWGLIILTTLLASAAVWQVQRKVKTLEA